MNSINENLLFIMDNILGRQRVLDARAESLKEMKYVRVQETGSLLGGSLLIRLEFNVTTAANAENAIDDAFEIAKP